MTCFHFHHQQTLHLVRCVVSHCTPNQTSIATSHHIINCIAIPSVIASSYCLFHVVTRRLPRHIICAWQGKYSAITASRDCTAVSVQSWQGSAPDSSRTLVCTMQQGSRSSHPSGGNDDGGATTTATTTASPRGEAAPGRAPRVDCRRGTITNALLGNRVPP